MDQTARMILSAVCIGVFFPATAAQTAPVEQRQAEIVAKADSLFRQHYSPKSTVPLAYDKEYETGPPGGPIYWFDASYVVQLIFARDGSLARVEVLPEALLYSKSWMNVRDTDNVELGKGELHWLLDTFNRLQPLGDPIEILEPPNGCFRSGPNLYCQDSYKGAIVNQDLREQSDKDKSERLSLKSATIAYKQFVVGTISERNVLSPNAQRPAPEYHVKIGSRWYRIEWYNEKLFHDAVVGSVAHLTTFGCAANQVLCEVLPEDVTPKR